MGGNLFKLGRIPREAYLPIETDIRAYLDTRRSDFDYRIPRYYGAKPDFGDLDIVIAGEALKQNWESVRAQIVQDLGIQKYRSAGNVFSTVYRDFQVDYFVVAPRFLESSYHYLSFNDLGNLIGKICRRFDLKYGDRGLVYVYRRQDGHYKRDLEVSLDFAQICGFLELNYQKWEQGFMYLEEMFEWITASPYFSVEPYLKMDKTLEKRTERRTTIQRFIEYIQAKSIKKRYPYRSNRKDYLPWIIEKFPTAKLDEQIAREVKAERKAREIQNKFNGKLVMQLIPSLEGKVLGQFIVAFKTAHPDFEDYILSHSDQEIQADILNFYQNTDFKLHTD